MRIDLGDDDQPEIGLIALIDCIFFLLMFFMVATSFKQKEQQHKDKPLPIQLPRSSATLVRTQAAPDPLVIRVDRAGRVSIGAEEGLGIEALHERLRDEAQRQPGRPVRIEGDGRVPYQSIVRVLDLCQFEGLTNIAMLTRRE
ncbi:ExbD/TolR family protein [Massilia sp. LXY-6]|uniref:ExbD/TolR family protein n=1 Tax=Massilia sp. LXY-6 TaxID=3379823 RepID=UPI003EE2CB23